MRKSSGGDEAPLSAQGAAVDAELPGAVETMPQEGGAWIRNADGSLARDPVEHPEQEA